MSNQEIQEAEAKLAALRAEHGDDKPAQTLFDSLGSLLHGVVNLLPWRQESDKQAAHDAVEEHAAPLGRNTVPAGVVESDTAKTTENQGNENSFPGSTPKE